MPQEKYLSKNPIAAYLVGNFFDSLRTLLKQAIDELDQRHTYFEIGCGEGELFARLDTIVRNNFHRILGCDINREALAYARTRIPWARFLQASIYDLQAKDYSAEILICCEVLEHLADPEEAVNVLAGLCKGYAIVSAPREPVWRLMNMARCKYVKDFGNTPGHINHWSADGFCRLLSERFDIVKLLRPLPWTMLLLKPKEG